ncbi:glycosyltransferase family 1 protein [Lentibacillus sediminis]|uniref:glycosyltransferase family 1 protein n=1 Tax=Lentibacillus sediminis TaxID=1940529 RepID=UPI000C1C7054|nr:glycosyltransferase family 1 protein [Lentibacillus sediminis]
MDKSRPARILHVVGAMNRAGTETMLMNIYRNINREHLQFDFVSYSRESAHYDQEIKKLGGNVFHLSKTTSMKELYHVMKKHGPYAAVHSHTLFHCGIANAAAILAGIKIRIAHAHTTEDDSGTFLRRVYIAFMRFIILCSSTKLLACSKGAARYLFGSSVLQMEKYAYFPNVINYEAFLKHRGAEVKKYKMEKGMGNSMVIGHIGRFIEAKNHLFLLDIFKRLLEKDPTIKLLLVGDGELKKYIEKRAKREGIYENITFAGIRDDIDTMLHSMDVFVFPSLYEGLGLVLLEAQASGVSCVVSEAIQHEADVGLNLLWTLSLEEGGEVWAEKIRQAASAGKERNAHRVKAAFEQSGYSLDEGVSTLMDIYQISGREKNERHVNRFF